MVNDKEIVVKNGLGISGWLTIIFVVAKLLGKISWSWWWVFAPLWIPILIGFGILLVVLIIMLLAAIAK